MEQQPELQPAAGVPIEVADGPPTGTARGATFSCPVSKVLPLGHIREMVKLPRDAAHGHRGSMLAQAR